MGSYLRREMYFLTQEGAGTITFRYLTNDNSTQHNIWLVALKNIYSKQLPNMPREYITRLVFDQNHSSVAAVRNDGVVVGGITYRRFSSQGFGEIAFCAVGACDQVKGIGSRLMSYTKEYAKVLDNLKFFLTYADNNAVNFFGKQGFTANITMAVEQWHGYIKDYDGGTFMECILHSELPYTNMANILSTQLDKIKDKIESHHPKSFYKYPGINQILPKTYSMRDACIPGFTSNYVTRSSNLRILLDGQICKLTPDTIARLGKLVMNFLQSNSDSVAFFDPVSAEEVPDYYDIIKDPMDFHKVLSRLNAKNFYVTLAAFLADVQLIFNNARLYNALDTYWHKAANRLEKSLMEFLNSKLLLV